MADVDSSATLNVTVTGEDQVTALANAFDNLASKSGSTSSTTFDTASAKAAAIQTVKDMTAAASQAQEEAATTLWQDLSKPGGWRAYWDAIKKGGREGLELASADLAAQRETAKEASAAKRAEGEGVPPLGTVAGAAVAGVVGGMMAAVTSTIIESAGALVSALNPISHSLDAATEAAKRTMDTWADAQKTQVSLKEAAADNNAAQLLNIKNTDTMSDRMSKFLTPERVAKHQDLYNQLGITPEKMDEMARAGKRFDPLEMLQGWARQFDTLKQMRDKAQGQEREALNKQITGLQDAIVQGLPRAIGQQMVDTLRRYTEDDIRKARAAGAETAGLGPFGKAPDEQLRQGATDLQMSMKSLGQKYDTLWDTLGTIATPSITKFFDALNQKATELGPALAQLGGTAASKVWDTLSSAIEQLDVKRIADDLNKMNAALTGVDTAAAGKNVGEQISQILNSITKALEGMRTFFTAIGDLFKTPAELLGLPEWMKNIPGLKPLFPEEKPATEKDLSDITENALKNGAKEGAKEAADATANALKGGAEKGVKDGLQLAPGGAAFTPGIREAVTPTPELKPTPSAPVPVEVVKSTPAPPEVRPAAPTPAPEPLGHVGSGAPPPPAERAPLDTAGIAGAISSAISSGGAQLAGQISAAAGQIGGAIQSGVAGAAGQIQSAMAAGGSAAAAALQSGAGAWGAAAAAAFNGAVKNVTGTITVNNVGGGGGGTSPSGAPTGVDKAD